MNGNDLYGWKNSSSFCFDKFMRTAIIMSEGDVSVVYFVDNMIVHDGIDFETDDLDIIDLCYNDIPIKTLNVTCLAHNTTTFLVMYKILIHGQSLTSLFFESCEISDDIIECLGKFLKNNKTVKFIEIKNTTISDTGIKYLTDSIKYNTSIQELTISDNIISNIAMKYLSDALKHNKSITDFNFIKNNNQYINNFSVVTISKDQKFKNNLMEKKSYKSTIKGFRYLFEMLKINTTITTFYIDFNNINTTNAKYLNDMLNINTTIKHLKVILPNQINCNFYKYIIKGLENNNTVVYFPVEGPYKKYINKLIFMNNNVV